MQQAPAWLSYASPLISMLALAISAATFWRNSPKVRARAQLYIVRTRIDFRPRLEVRIYNWSSSPVEVRDIAIVRKRESRVHGSPPSLNRTSQVGKIGTPYELQAHTFETWKYDVPGIGFSVNPPFEREWVAKLAKRFQPGISSPMPRMSPENEDSNELEQQFLAAEARQIEAYNRSTKAKVYRVLAPLRGQQKEDAFDEVFTKYRVTVALSTGRVVKRRIRWAKHSKRYDLSQPE